MTVSLAERVVKTELKVEKTTEVTECMDSMDSNICHQNNTNGGMDIQKLPILAKMDHENVIRIEDLTDNLLIDMKPCKIEGNVDEFTQCIHDKSTPDVVNNSIQKDDSDLDCFIIEDEEMETRVPERQETECVSNSKHPMIPDNQETIYEKCEVKDKFTIVHSQLEGSMNTEKQLPKSEVGFEITQVKIGNGEVEGAETKISKGEMSEIKVNKTQMKGCQQKVESDMSTVIGGRNSNTMLPCFNVKELCKDVSSVESAKSHSPAVSKLQNKGNECKESSQGNCEPLNLVMKGNERRQFEQLQKLEVIENRHSLLEKSLHNEIKEEKGSGQFSNEDGSSIENERSCGKSQEMDKCELHNGEKRVEDVNGDWENESIPSGKGDEVESEQISGETSQKENIVKEVYEEVSLEEYRAGDSEKNPINLEIDSDYMSSNSGILSRRPKRKRPIGKFEKRVVHRGKYYRLTRATSKMSE